MVDDGRSLEIGGRKQRVLLATLLLGANRVVSTDRLIDALWEEEPPETAQKALQVYVSQLRKLLGSERLETRPPGYLLRVEPDEFDLARFRVLQAGGQFSEALSLWRGPPLEEFALERFARVEVARLEELRLACLEGQIERELAAGRHGELAGELEALVEQHPLRERLRALQMLALYRAERQAEALVAYQDARRALVEGLGLEPGKSLRELHQAILNQDPALDLAPGGEQAADPASRSFVGRDGELAELVGGLEEVIAGRGRLFLLVGEPGIGKSRLAEELARRAHARGAEVLVGRCWEAGGAPAFWPWVQSLRAHIRTASPDALRADLGAGGEEVAQLLPELRELFPELTEPVAVDSENARFRLFDATADFLRRACERRPIVLVLDDLHAADTPSLLLLQFLARQLGSISMLVVGAFRDVDPIPGQPLKAMLAEVAREPVTRRLVLAGLSEQEVATYIELTAAEIASPELAAALHEETEGNPLFVGETVRLLAVEGAGSEPIDVVIAIPESVRDVIARRLGHLSEECNRVLLLASVLGREFVLDALAEAAGVSDDDLLDRLDEAMAARVVSDVPGSPGTLRFAHVLIRDTLYEGLTTPRRVRLHRLAVAALEALYGEELGPHLAELVHHSIAGSDFNKGVRYAEQAGHRAQTLLAYEEAARLYEAALGALKLASPSDEKTRCERLLSLGEAQARAGNSSDAKQAFLEAAGIARRLGLASQLARAAAGYGGRAMWSRAGADDRLVPLLEEGLAALAEEDVELRARLLARLAGALRDEPSRQRRDSLSAEAVELARRMGNAAALAYALDGRVAATLAPDTIAECLALSGELGQVAERIGDTERVVHAHIHRYLVQVMVGDLSEAKADHAAASRAADELRQPGTLWQVLSAKAMLALMAGRLTEAEELISQAFALGERAQPEMAIPVHRLQRYALCDFQGRLEQIAPVISDLVIEYPARPAFRCALAHLYAQLGRTEDARREFEQLASDDFFGLPFDMEWLYGMSLLAETCVLLHDTDAAAILYRLLAPWAELNAADHPEGNRGSVSRYLGILAAMVEQWEDADDHFKQAVAMNKRTGARPWLAHTQHDYGRMLLARDTPGDRERARELFAAAQSTYRELGMKRYAAIAEEANASR